MMPNEEYVYDFGLFQTIGLAKRQGKEMLIWLESFLQLQLKQMKEFIKQYEKRTAKILETGVKGSGKCKEESCC